MRTIFLLLSFFAGFSLHAQFNINPNAGNGAASGKPKSHISWKYEVKPDSAIIGQTAEIIFTATLDDEWHVYGSDFKLKEGPTVTTLSTTKLADCKLTGEFLSIKPERKYEDVWPGEVTFFHHKGVFKQKVTVSGKYPLVSGIVEYQICSNSGCLPPAEYEFEVVIPVKAAATKSSKATAPGTKASSESTMPEEKAPLHVMQQPITDTVAADVIAAEVTNDTVGKTNHVSSSVTSKTDKALMDDSLWAFFLKAFLFGLTALLTPCVFPMIPMTVSFFINNSKTHAQAVQKGLIYGSSIVGIYTLIGLLVVVVFGQEALASVSSNWVVNLVFFLTFVVFAASFLGLFEITLPSSFVNKVDQQSDRGGMLGIFFMAFTIVLVSFSCTGPIVSSILIDAAGGKVIKPVVGMFGFSLAFAIPFATFAMFPSLLKALPKSGGWLNSVKVTLGFLELALAMKFLSQADLVSHWRLLDRDVFIAIWIIIFTLLGFYLIRKIQLSHDDGDYTEQPISVQRLFLGMASFTFVVYLVPGLFGAPLKALSGYLPPLSTSDFVLGATAKGASADALCETPKYAELLHLPHNLPGYFDLKQAQECSRKTGKPLFIDFTGHTCVNCREMEANVWSRPEVLERLKKDFIVVSLYADERTELPESEWFTSTLDGKVKKTIGKQNQDVQLQLFNQNALPFYAITDASGNSLAEPRGYNRDVEAFVQFLDTGKKNFKK